MQTFAALQTWLDGLPDQGDGVAASVSDAGEPYVEFHECGIARPDDVEMVEQVVAGMMAHHLSRYFADRKGRIYWRVRLETVKEPHTRIVRYDDAGPDLDFALNKKCLKDSNWLKVACYCRLYRARLAVPEGRALDVVFGKYTSTMEA